MIESKKCHRMARVSARNRRHLMRELALDFIQTPAISLTKAIRWVTHGAPFNDHDASYGCIGAMKGDSDDEQQGQ
jgi:hypothetical protein